MLNNIEKVYDLIKHNNWIFSKIYCKIEFKKFKNDTKYLKNKFFNEFFQWIIKQIFIFIKLYHLKKFENFKLWV